MAGCPRLAWSRSGSDDVASQFGGVNERCDVARIRSDDLIRASESGA
jgi:hypothetical protein